MSLLLAYFPPLFMAQHNRSAGHKSGSRPCSVYCVIKIKWVMMAMPDPDMVDRSRPRYPQA